MQLTEKEFRWFSENDLDLNFRVLERSMSNAIGELVWANIKYPHTSTLKSDPTTQIEILKDEVCEVIAEISEDGTIYNFDNYLCELEQVIGVCLSMWYTAMYSPQGNNYRIEEGLD